MGQDRILEKRLSRLPQVEGWPSAEEAEASRWFSPIRYGAATAHARTWVPAMVPWRATDDGFVTEQVLDWYRRFAEGQPGVLVVEATGIRDVPSGPLLRIGHDRYLPGLQRLAEAVRDASEGKTRLFIQLIDFLAIRRRPERARFLCSFLKIEPSLRERAAATWDDPSLLHEAEERVRGRLVDAEEDDLSKILSARDWESYRFGYRERVGDLHLEHIRELPRRLPDLFGDAARRAEEAGFDGVELHYAHAYTMASFLSPRNDRSDGYGGPRENRVRLPLEVHRLVRERVGRDFVVGCRYLGDEAIEGGSSLEDAIWFALRFGAAGFDFLSISKGGKFEDARQPKVGHAAYPYTGPSGAECMPTVDIDEAGPFGRNLHLAAAIRQALREAGHETPVIAAGGISTFAQAEAALAEGAADAVASARQTLADPDWFQKLRLGRGEEIRRCFFTNYCEALDQAHKEVTCQRWDRLPGSEQDVVFRARDGRRRLVAPRWERSRDDG